MVVLLDEPELHLHPKALISFIDYLKSEEAVEMCCIATHSIFLIPLFDFYEIIHIERGVVQTYNSKLYNDIFENIIGKNESLSDFLFLGIHGNIISLLQNVFIYLRWLKK